MHDAGASLYESAFSFFRSGASSVGIRPKFTDIILPIKPCNVNGIFRKSDVFCTRGAKKSHPPEGDGKTGTGSEHGAGNRA